MIGKESEVANSLISREAGERMYWCKRLGVARESQLVRDTASALKIVREPLRQYIQTHSLNRYFTDLACRRFWCET